MTKSIISKTRKHIAKSKKSTKKSMRKFAMMLKSRRAINNMGLAADLADAYLAAEQLLDLLRKTEKKLDEHEAVELAKVDAKIVTAAKTEGHMCLNDVNGNVDENSEVFSIY